MQQAALFCALFDPLLLDASEALLLRKRLIGSRITRMEQAGLDRIVRFSFSGRDELLDETTCSLVVELMGKHGNAFLLDENDVILDCLRHIGLGAEALRVCLPNVKYEALPPQGKRDPLSATLEELLASNPSPAFRRISSISLLWNDFSKMNSKACWRRWANSSARAPRSAWIIPRGTTAPRRGPTGRWPGARTSG